MASAQDMIRNCALHSPPTTPGLSTNRGDWFYGYPSYVSYGM